MSKIAILIDGAYLLRRLPAVYYPNNPGDNPHASGTAAKAIRRLVASHLRAANKIVQVPNEWALLHRVFYYDAVPYLEKAHLPISQKPINYAETKQAKYRLMLFDHLRRVPNTAVRLGTVQRERGWMLKESVQRLLLKGEVKVGDLTDDDFIFDLGQKAVDMRIGMDIASLAIKQQVDTIILVAGDADFVPASKLARREGVKVILDPLWLGVADELSEHIDGVRSGFPRPGTGESAISESEADYM